MPKMVRTFTQLNSFYLSIFQLSLANVHLVARTFGSVPVRTDILCIAIDIIDDNKWK